MTVVDSSAIVDLLLDEGVVDEVGEFFSGGAQPPSAPDVVVFEVLSALRRAASRRSNDARVATAVSRFGELSLEIFPSMRMRTRVWELRRNFSVGDALFVTLAELLGEPLVTKDAGLARAAAEHTSVEVRLLTTGAN